MPNQHYYTPTIRDYSNETSGTKIHFGAVTALNIAGFLAQLGDLRTALGNMILGIIARDAWIGDSTVQSNTTPSDTNAQIELKFQFIYEGVNSKKRYRIEVPTADTTKVLPNSDKLDLADTDVAAFVTAFETIGRTPDDDTEGVNVVDARLVGRNV